MMEHNPSYSMGLFMNYVNHGCADGLVWRFQGSEAMGGREIHMMLFEMKRGICFGEHMKLSF
jgi:hypothetical protein